MRKALCIDIGGTRIKSAVLPERPTFDQARSAPSKVIRTLGWLNHSLPKLVDPEYWPSLAAYYRRRGITYERVALSVPGGIDSEGRFIRPDLVEGPAAVPEDLLAALEGSAGCPVSLVNDAEAWMAGFEVYAEQSRVKFEYPAVLLAFGTGLGVSMAASPNDVTGFDAAGISPASWSRLPTAANFEITEGWHVHRIVGRHFFAFVEEEHPEWDHLRIRKEYSKRVKAAFLDLLPSIEESVGTPVKTLVLAGGNAEYVSVRGLEETGCNVISLTDGLSKIPPDLITVLGVEESSRRSTPSEPQ